MTRADRDRVAGAAAVAGFVLAALSGWLFLVAAGFHARALLEPALQLQFGPRSAPTLYRWAALTDMLGSYLAVVPILLWAARRIRPLQAGLADVAASCAVLFAGIGALAAGVLSAVAPPLLQAAGGAGAGGGAAAAFRALTDGVFKGAWQTVEVLPLAAWAVVVAVTLRQERPPLATAGFALAAGCVAMSAVRMWGGPPPTALAATIGAVFGAAFWIFVLGLATDALRGRVAAPAPRSALEVASALSGSA